MDDSISRQAAINAIKTSRYLVDAMEKIIKLSSAQPERKMGHWILRAEGSMFPFMCDQCGERHNSTSNFCPNCGADMRGERDEQAD